MWLEIAENLPLGRKTRVQCCGKNKDAIIAHTHRGYSYYCFRCDTRLFHSIDTHTLEQLAKIKELNEQPAPVEIPEDFLPTIPIQHSVWLYKAGISTSRYIEAGIGWSDSLQRIVIPVYSTDGELLYFQCRAVHKGQLPKYSNPSREKSSLLYMAGWGYSKQRVVVTEDILSCIRVGKHIPAACILGTKTSDEQAGILSQFKHVTYWLDNDDAGHRGARAGTAKLRLATHADSIHSQHDPKEYSDREIRQYLGLCPTERYTYHGCIVIEDIEAQETL